ncbi:MAG: right-handed parallel beta-helix repeat-containing protein [Armatimonadetes bacterium]|nr:right-handed parallel beta-helix repeat-containing protein [Armatimonadota bacterium]
MVAARCARAALGILAAVWPLGPAASATTLHVSQSPLAGVPVTAQVRTLGEAAARARAGDRVVIHGGTYPEAVTIEADGTRERPIRFEAAPNAVVVVTGADRLLDWRKEPSPEGENVCSAPWPHRFIGWSPTGTHPADDYHKLIGRAEQVFVNGYALHQVLSRTQVGRGTFYADLEGRRLIVQASNNAALGPDSAWSPRVEASVRQTLWDVRGDRVLTRGIAFRYGATQAQQALVRLGGAGDAIEDCTIEHSNTDGADFRGPGQAARRCRFMDNGQDGFTGGNAHGLLISDCVIRNNNTKNFDRGWGAGGCKVVLSRGVVMERSRFTRNRGHGIWFDIGNEACVVRNCLIADNEDAGVFYEISYGLHAHDNVIARNGLLSSGGAWGANGGIALSSSPGCLIERNLFFGNKEGFQFREQMRRTPRIGAAEGAPEVWVWNHHDTVRGNLFAYNRDAQVWGWWTTFDERHWPERMQTARRERPSYVPEADFAREYQAALDGGAPRGLSLEALALGFSGNVYAVEEGRGLFHWAAPWLRNRRYTRLDEVRRELGLEQGGVVATVAFADPLRDDFRLPADVSAQVRNAAPRGVVPGAQAGVAAPVAGAATRPACASRRRAATSSRRASGSPGSRARPGGWPRARP